MIACHQAMFVRLKQCPSYRQDLRYQGDLNWVMDILDHIDQKDILYISTDIVYFKSGGFSDHTIWNQLTEHLYLIYHRYGWWIILVRLPRLCRRYIGKWLRRWLGIESFRFWITTQ